MKWKSSHPKPRAVRNLPFIPKTKSASILIKRYQLKQKQTTIILTSLIASIFSRPG